MNDTFYAGHNMKWIRAFLNAIPKDRKFKKSTAYGIACCVHHQFVYKKHPTFQITHKLLDSFGINRKSLKPYLILFQQAGLIEYIIEKGKSPTITLLSLPDSYYTVNKTTIRHYKDTYTVPLSPNGQVHVPKWTGSQSRKKGKGTYPPSKGTYPPSKGTYPPAREPTPKVRELTPPSKGTYPP